MLRFLFAISFCVLMLFLPAMTKRFTKGFRLAKIRLEFPHHPEWEVPLNWDLSALLNQSFHYLDKGSQCYVFASADGQYVIKFFRYDQPANKEKVVHLFNACKIAYDYLLKETGLIFIHVNPTQLGLPKIRCTDPVGRRITFDLNSCRFAIQKRAKPFEKTLKKARNDPLKMKDLLDQLIDLLVARSEKGILNTDPSLSRNFGFLDSCAIELDFGNYRYVGEIDSVKEIRRYTDKLKRWLAKNGPEWVEYVDQKVKTLK